MWIRLLLLLPIAAVLGALFAGYRSTVLPLVEAPERQQISRSGSEGHITQPAANRQSALEHLEDHPWVAEARYQLRMEEGLVYTNERRLEKEDGLLRLKPFAAILEVGPGQKPYTIVSDSAVLKFATTFDMANPDPGRVVSAALEGTVSIAGPDGLLVEGRNFVFWESALRIWSDEPVRFRYQKHFGKAHGLQVELIPEQGALPSGRPAVAGIRSVRLRQNVDVTMQPEEGKQPVHVKAAGSFYFYLDSLTAEIEDDVLVYQSTGDDQFDWMRCDLLSLWFQNDEQWELAEGSAPAEAEKISPLPDVPPPPAETRDAAFTTVAGPLRFRRLHASGAPVQMASQKNALHTESTSAIYDAAWRLMRLADDATVKVAYESNELRSPRVSIRHDADNQLVAAACEGTGWLETHDTKNERLAFAADWAAGMHYQRGSHDELSVISLIQEATVRQPAEQTGLGADLIQVWMKETHETPLDDLRTRSRDSTSPAVQIERVRAADNVAVLTPEFQGETELLEIHVAGDSGEDSEGRSIASADETGSDVRQVSHEEAALDRLVVRADRIVGEAIRRGAAADLTLRSIVTTGSIRVRQEGDGDSGVDLSGDELRMDAQSDGQEVIRLSGSPAEVRGEQLRLEGNEIHLDRGAGSLRVVGGGQLDLPMNRDLQGNPLAEPKLTSIKWQDEMRLAGRTCIFLGNTTAQLDKSQMLCHRLRVQFDAAIDFHNSSSSSQSPEIDRIRCEDGVEFHDYVYQGPKLTEIRKVKVWQFDYERTSGKTSANGPGSIRVSRRGQARKAALAPSSAVRANRAVQAETAEWELIQIEFAGQMNGNVNERYTTFDDRVRIVYGPIQRPNDGIDPDRLSEGAGWMRCGSLRMSQSEMPDGRTAVQLHGSENAEIEGKTFRARADSITYDESKGQYVLRSLGSRKATIWRQVRAGTEWDAGVDARRMEFVPARNQLVLDHATEIQGLQ